MDVIAGIQSALEITGKLRELSKKVQDAEFSMLLADLTMQLADTKLVPQGFDVRYECKACGLLVE